MRIGAPKIENGVVRGLGLMANKLTDISPVRALAGLRTLRCAGSSQGESKLSDLSPLQGMNMTSVNCGNTQVSDLSPLQGMQGLGWLYCNNTQVSDLSVLQRTPALGNLDVQKTNVTAADIAALQKSLPKCKILWDHAEKK